MIALDGKSNYQISIRQNAIIVVSFLLTISVLAAIFVVPKANSLLGTEHNEKIQAELDLKVDLFTKYLNSQILLLHDRAQVPDIIRAAMLADASDARLHLIFDNMAINGAKANVVLQDIDGNMLISSTDNLLGSYANGFQWTSEIINSKTEYYLRLLRSEVDTFTFQLSVPLRYSESIEGVFSAEIVGNLSDIFFTKPSDPIAYRLMQNGVVISTSSDKISIAREDQRFIKGANLNLVYVTDDKEIVAKRHQLRNSILLVLLVGLSVAFMLFVIIEFSGFWYKNISAKTLALTRENSIPLAIAVIGVAASSVTFVWIGKSQHRSVDEHLLADSKMHVRTIRENLVRSLDSLKSVKAYIEASTFVDKNNFSTFASQMIKNNNLIHAFYWVPRVPLAEHSEFDVNVWLDGLPAYSVTRSKFELETKNANLLNSHFLVKYAEPLSSKKNVLGKDYGAHLAARGIYQKTVDPANKVVNQILLVSDTENPEDLMIFIPVYESSRLLNTDRATRSNHLRGYAVLELNVVGLFELISQHEHVDGINARDITVAAAPVLLFNQEATSNNSVAHRETIEVAGILWDVGFSINSRYLTTRWFPYLILLGGIMLTLCIVWLIQLIQRREHADALAKKNNFLIHMMSNSNDAFIATEFRHGSPQHSSSIKYSYVNDSFARLAGFTKEEIIGSSIENVIGSNTDEKELNTIVSSIVSGEVYLGELELYEKDGTSFWAEISLTPFLSAGGEVVHTIGLLRNITDRRNADQERERLIGKLSDSNEELERFAYVCSHDLQEPLRMIRSFSDRLSAHLISDIEGDVKAKKYLGFVADGAERAQLLVDDILSYSSINSATEKNEAVDCELLIGSIDATMRNLLDENNGSITHEKLPVLFGNKTQLYQIFQNLINNAVKYKKAETAPRVHIFVSDKGEFWQFAVQDNGIGISQKHIHKVFDVFQRLHRNSQYSGTGIGLSICKKVVERHGGVLWVESEPDKGSTFYFTLAKQMINEVAHEQQRKAG